MVIAMVAQSARQTDLENMCKHNEPWISGWPWRTKAQLEAVQRPGAALEVRAADEPVRGRRPSGRSQCRPRAPHRHPRLRGARALLANRNSVRPPVIAVKSAEPLLQIETREVLPAATPETPFGLGVAVIYQDHQSREWVSELCNRVARLIGAQAFRPGAFQETVTAASGADVIIVSLQAVPPLDPRFRAWVDAWSRERRRADGTLIALAGVPGRPGAPSEHVQEYLRVVAWEARLEFLLREYTIAVPDCLPIT